MRKVFLCLIMIAVLATLGCGGGGGPTVPDPMTVGQITGPSSVNGGESGSFSISASGATGITYHWSVSPPAAGYFDNSAAASVIFYANEVTSDTGVTIQVDIAAPGQTTQNRTKAITVIYVPTEQIGLTGLEGVWDYHVNSSGELTRIPDDGTTLPVDRDMSGYFLIDTFSIVDNFGLPWVWEYDGTTLSMWALIELPGWTADCGDDLFALIPEYVIHLPPNSTTGVINGTELEAYASEYCGGVSGTLQVTGNMTKR